MKNYNIPYYICGCGYETSNPGNASRHKKVECGCEMLKSFKEFVLKEDYERQEITTHTVSSEQFEKMSALVSTKDGEIDKLNKIIQQQRKTILKISETYEPEIDDEDNEDGVGIIYYITDKDLSSRGKIGRTKNTDLKKLKSRYSTFSKPGIMCFYSTDIKKDENDLKTILKEKGYMDTSIGKETVVNCAETRAVFHDFASR
ncbi:hypothetical protein FR483_N029R [Paramecium bursaria Chlorella virus FR483]|uniref:Uncharacterized protein N029R n=1 Tax=Paramecium bursaria Chlorella virus FR483 TaxID=399781 RepID=A7J683_PBCVF|nr:hypothetical protein FR483_N029R [Paramecium bursaria Chlorella virus FR483]ABT15314.1 hypothetical protein FR483_N029R [Paramecium bursaria Chlorella virus FR483]